MILRISEVVVRVILLGLDAKMKVIDFGNKSITLLLKALNVF